MATLSQSQGIKLAQKHAQRRRPRSTRDTINKQIEADGYPHLVAAFRMENAKVGCGRCQAPQYKYTLLVLRATPRRKNNLKTYQMWQEHDLGLHHTSYFSTMRHHAIQRAHELGIPFYDRVRIGTAAEPAEAMRVELQIKHGTAEQGVTAAKETR
jgi:hypothetical protein